MSAASPNASTSGSGPNQPNSSSTMTFHDQTTVVPANSRKSLELDAKHDAGHVNGTTTMVTQHRPSSTQQSPRDTSPNKPVSPATSAKHTAPRSAALHSSRFHDPATVDSSPVATRMNTVPEDEPLPDLDDQNPNRGRRSVQFTRDSPLPLVVEPSSNSPLAEEKTDEIKSQSFYSRLRALASTQGLSHIRSASGVSTGGRSTDGRDGDQSSAGAAMQATLDDADTDADADADADADEESGAEAAFSPVAVKKKKRKFRRNDIETAPSSPQSLRPNLSTVQTAAASTTSRPQSLIRRATDGEASNARAGVSEDEGRSRLEGPSSWKPRHPLRGLSYGNQRKLNDDGNTSERENSRPRGLLRLNTISSSSKQQDTMSPDNMTPKQSRRRMLQERGSTLSAAKWRQIKNSLRAFGPSKKKETSADQVKSAELLAELQAGGPAALILGSFFQRDEHGNRRIPALLEQLKVSVTDSELDRYKEPGNPTPGDRHIIFRIELEYGSGVNRMKWVIRRSLKDFANLHAKYKLHFQSEKFKGRGDSTTRMPKFPRKVFPFLKGIKGMDDEDDDDEPADQTDAPGPDSARPDTRPPNPSRPSTSARRRTSGPTDLTPTTPGGTNLLWGRYRPGGEKDVNFPQKQRKMLEDYLRAMIKFLLFKADANRLCKFLELSALGMRLASEGSYHGKEGYLVIRSAKGLDFRKTLTPNNIKTRHTPKWFLVRHSYIVCVDSPEAMHIYDVFLFDPDFKIQSSRPALKDSKEKRDVAQTAKDIGAKSKEIAKHPQHHRLKLQNSERKLKLLARNERVLHQFAESIRVTFDNSDWCKPNRFDSFAPVRQKCFAQWLVDGRDHMWVVSRALNQARDVIYIHDWWLSPELYMRRPPAISQKWRLDRLLKRKAEQGVKVFVIVYRNIDAAVPIDSQYTKFSLLDLHPNIFVQRSPNQFRQNTFFWAHHEKLCIVDHTVAFVGGIDLCFGRWDTPQHVLTDDKPTGFEIADGPKDGDHCQLWPGKDYSNPREQDFYDLNKPYEEMYDRTQIARMPWHDISMQVVGQPARDLTRHFVQRWNYILRQRKPTRPTPFLLPAPDFNQADLEALGLDGTCEVQMLRSAGPWSLGTPDRVEHSIMNAYIKMIEESEHFVYIENQFFISTCVTEGATVQNKIGDALVERITRAAENDEDWRAVIVIPLIPGFQNTVEEEGGTSVRLIMQYQYRSICRGESSIFGRLKAVGIEPEDYIQFYSLRQWGKIGPRNALTTEQLYIHAKVIIVDDRIALIGSANINERSQLGNRDSEVAAVVRDTDTMWSTMAGKPYRVGRFAYSLRMRLMREHLGLDVDSIMEEAQLMEHDHLQQEQKAQRKEHPASPDITADDENDPLAARGREMQEEYLQRNEGQHTFNHDVDWEQAGNPNLKTNRKMTEDSRVTGKESHRKDVLGEGEDNMAAMDEAGYGIGRDSVILKSAKEVLVADLDTEGHMTLTHPRDHGEVPRVPSYVRKMEAPNPPMPPKPMFNRLHTEDLGLTLLSQLPALPTTDDSDIGGPGLEHVTTHSSMLGTTNHGSIFNELHYPPVDRDVMKDPIADHFLDETWHVVAENNTKIYRAVFRCMPDNLVRDWREYHQYIAYEQRFQQLQGGDPSDKSHNAPASDDHQHKRAGPPGVGSGVAAATHQLKNLSKVPSDLEKMGGGLVHKITGVFDSAEVQKEKAAEKEALKNWAKDMNHAQMKRTNTDLTARPSLSYDEKEAEKDRLQTVPEDNPVHHARPSDDIAPDEPRRSSLTDGPGEAVLTHPPTVAQIDSNSVSGTTLGSGSQKRRRRGTTRSSRRDFSASDDIMGLAEAEELLGKVQGHLIQWPYDWLERVEAGGNWLFPFDQISPIEIYI